MMETNTKKQAMPNEGQTNKEHGQYTDQHKTTEGQQAWWEQLAGVLSGDKEGAKNWYKLLSSPLLAIVGLFVLGYFLFKQNRETHTSTGQENEQLRNEIARLQKKCKKLKKRIRTQTVNNGNPHLAAVLD